MIPAKKPHPSKILEPFLEGTDVTKIKNNRANYLSRAKLVHQPSNQTEKKSKVIQKAELDRLSDSYIDDNWYFNFSTPCKPKV